MSIPASGSTPGQNYAASNPDEALHFGGFFPQQADFLPDYYASKQLARKKKPNGFYTLFKSPKISDFLPPSPQKNSSQNWLGKFFGGLAVLSSLGFAGIFAFARPRTAIIDWFSNLKKRIRSKSSSTPSSNNPTHSPSPIQNTMIEKIEALPIGRLTLNQLFGPNLKEHDALQRSGYSCYVLTAIDQILQHHNAEAMLAHIQVYKLDAKNFEIRFHNQQPVQVNLTDLSKGSTASCSYPGIPILEQAYLATKPIKQRTEWDDYNFAMRAFIPNSEWPHAKQITIIPGLSDLGDAWQSMNNALVQHRSNPMQTAFIGARINKNHWLSVRLDESTDTQIACWNPQHGTELQKFTYEEFLKLDTLGSGRTT